MLYLLVITPPLGTAKKQSRFYLGFSPNKRTLINRLDDHAKGRGSRMTQVAVERGHRVSLVGVCEGTRGDERRLKQKKHHSRLIGMFRVRKGLERFVIEGVA